MGNGGGWFYLVAFVGALTIGVRCLWNVASSQRDVILLTVVYVPLAAFFLAWFSIWFLFSYTKTWL